MKVVQIKTNNLKLSIEQSEQIIREEGLVITPSSRTRDLIRMRLKYPGIVTNREWKGGLIMVIDLKLRLKRQPSESLPWKIDDIGSVVQARGSEMPELGKVLSMMESDYLPLPLSPKNIEYGDTYDLAARVVIHRIDHNNMVPEYDIDWDDGSVKHELVSGGNERTESGSNPA